MSKEDAQEITYLIARVGYGYHIPTQAPNSLLRMIHKKVIGSDYDPEDWRNAVRGMPLLWNFDESFSVSELIQNFDKALARGHHASRAEAYSSDEIWSMRPKT